jgi:hypothetical protein
MKAIKQNPGQSIFLLILLIVTISVSINEITKMIN